jgi:hypothetical protein
MQRAGLETSQQLKRVTYNLLLGTNGVKRG